ncbi:hypothetical protein [Streptomyces sp. YIM S03343]
MENDKKRHWLREKRSRKKRNGYNMSDMTENIVNANVPGGLQDAAVAIDSGPSGDLLATPAHAGKPWFELPEGQQQAKGNLRYAVLQKALGKQSNLHGASQPKQTSESDTPNAARQEVQGLHDEVTQLIGEAGEAREGVAHIHYELQRRRRSWGKIFRRMR